MRTILILLLFLPLAGPTLAADGVLEINQVCAAQSGCFKGDTPGFPVTLAASSHRLTSDLAPPPDTAAIDGVASNVRLDLAGFSMIGSTVGGAANGISFQGSHWEIRGGTVRNFSGSGISQSNAGDTGVSIVDMRLHDNGGSGAVVYDGAHIMDSHAHDNGGNGFWMIGEGARISASASRGNGNAGLITGDAASVVDFSSINSGVLGIASGNGSSLSNLTVFKSGGISGVSCGNGCKIDGVTTAMNMTHGMLVGDGATISDVSAYSNGSVGVICGDGCNLTKIVSHSNTTGALSVGTNSGYSECVLTGATTVSGGTAIGNRLNICNGSVICP